MGRQLKFDLPAFCRRFRLQQAAVFYAVKYIEREGHWTYSEDLETRPGCRSPSTGPSSMASNSLIPGWFRSWRR